jgi:hypothetical protein
VTQQFAAKIRLDITGNWQEFDDFLPVIQTSEPPLKEGESRSFKQNLTLPAGQYAIVLEYDVNRDQKDGGALRGCYPDFTGLAINGQTTPISFSREDDKKSWIARLPFTVAAGAPSVALALAVGNTRVMHTYLESAQDLPIHDRYVAVPAPEGGETLLVHGVPFVIRENYAYQSERGQPHKHLGVYRGSLYAWNENVEVPCFDVPVEKIHFLGMTHKIDFANGSWYSPKGDNGYSHFVGDKAGEIEITFTDGKKETVPIVFGYNLWYGRPWDLVWNYNCEVNGPGGANCENEYLFGGDTSWRKIIEDNLKLVDGVRSMGSLATNSRYIFTLDLQGRTVRSLTVRGAAELHEYPLIAGMTFETAKPSDKLIALPHVTDVAPNMPAVTPAEAKSESWRPGVEQIMHLLYTYVDEKPVLTEPEITEGYFGPRYDFRGTPYAVYAATYLYRNGPESASFIADSGMGCSSPVSSGSMIHYVQGMGVRWKYPPYFKSLTNWFSLYKEKAPGQMPGMKQAWSRGIGELIREAMAFGYEKFTDTYVEWLDDCLINDANPPHWIRVAGAPDCCTYKVMVGDVEERGNRENDGHGICMWGRYMIYHWKGHPVEWNRKYWPATRAAADWIQWQLDTDTIRPGARKDLLYNESECAYGYDFYSSFNCMHGLKLSVRMAKQLGETEAAARWQKLYERLGKGIRELETDESEFGLIWHTESYCDWQDHAHKLAHLQLATEGDTFTPLDDYTSAGGLEADYLQIDRNSYGFLMKDKNYNCVRMYGYGQGMMTQAALLLDEMTDAQEFIRVLLTYCYLPKFSGWASPEGIIVHRSGQYYLPVNGYMGQDSHVADSTKAMRLMLGVDDNNPDHLRLVPRYPSDWNYMAIDDFPVLTGSNRQKLGYVYERQPDLQKMQVHFERPVAKLSVRLGPIPEATEITEARVNGQAVTFRRYHSGDSDWVWVELQEVREAKIEIKMRN